MSYSCMDSICLKVLSGDAVIIRGQPKGGPPPERQLCLSNITAPRVARRAGTNAPETKDEVNEQSLHACTTTMSLAVDWAITSSICPMLLENLNKWRQCCYLFLIYTVISMHYLYHINCCIRRHYFTLSMSPTSLAVVASVRYDRVPVRCSHGLGRPESS